MPTTQETPLEFAEPLVNELRKLTKTGDGTLNRSQKVAHLKQIREQFAGFNAPIDEYLVSAVDHLQKSVSKAQANQAELRDMLEKIGAEPWHPAVFLGTVKTVMGDKAMVLHGTERRVVATDDSVKLADLNPGDEVLLGCELNVIRDRSPKVPAGGETAEFRGALEDGRLLLGYGDSEVVACPVGKLKEGLKNLKSGDMLRWIRNAWLALEKVEPEKEDHRYLLEEVPEISPEKIGGQTENLNRLLAALMLVLMHPKKAEAYGISGKKSILLIDPPGTGKTLMARVTASMVAKRSGQKCRFAVVKPSEWEDPYVGVTQRNIREFFESLRESAKDGYVVVFFDEVEAIGRIRGGEGGRHSDKFLATFLAELQGFEDRNNIAIIAASNRKDLLDPAVLERLSDIEIEVKRPDMNGTKEILDIHLPETIPFSPNGSTSPQTRREVIQTAVSLLFSPNGDNEVAVIRFNDGKERKIAARELISGRILEQIALQARQTALERDIATGEQGIRVEDVRNAAAQAIDRMRSQLTKRNVHAYLTDLPQDRGIVSVQAARPRVDASTRPTQTR